jgi:hypothetical protein
LTIPADQLRVLMMAWPATGLIGGGHLLKLVRSCALFSFTLQP